MVAVATSAATAVSVVVTAAVVLPIAATAAVALSLLLWAFVAIRACGFHAFKRIAVFVGKRLFVAGAAALLLLRLCLLLAVRALLAVLALRRAE